MTRIIIEFISLKLFTLFLCIASTAEFGIQISFSFLLKGLMCKKTQKCIQIIQQNIKK